MDAKHLKNGNNSKNTALIVDDELSNRVILKSLLKRLGYSVLEAQSGQLGVELFRTHNPDVVFMDVLMPVMDGYEATAKIKALAGGRFVPVIFLTAITDEIALARCIEAGGDDFITKPFNHTILHSKLQALERIRVLHSEIDNLYNRMRLEEEIAQRVFSIAVTSKNVAMGCIEHYTRSAAIFNGDLLLTAWAPSGDLHLLLGDFTGHGLSAALGALPTAGIFRAMTAKGFAPERILLSMNEELHSLLPTGMFLAAVFVLVSKRLQFVEIFNCGLPDVLVLDAMDGIRLRFSSQLVPLGILPWQDMAEGRQRGLLQLGWRILLVTDGITEARSTEGEFFGQDGLETVVTNNANRANIIEAINTSLDAFCGITPQMDDLSIVAIPCVKKLFDVNDDTQDAAGSIGLTHTPEVHSDTGMETRWRSSLSLGSQDLKVIDPVPILISQVREFMTEEFDNHALFDLLSKLYGDALACCAAAATIGDDSVVVPPADHIWHDSFTKSAGEREQLFAALPAGIALEIGLQYEQNTDERTRRLSVHVDCRTLGRGIQCKGILWL